MILISTMISTVIAIFISTIKLDDAVIMVLYDDDCVILSSPSPSPPPPSPSPVSSGPPGRCIVCCPGQVRRRKLCKCSPRNMGRDPASGPCQYPSGRAQHCSAPTLSWSLIMFVRVVTQVQDHPLALHSPPREPSRSSSWAPAFSEKREFVPQLGSCLWKECFNRRVRRY